MPPLPNGELVFRYVGIVGDKRVELVEITKTIHV